MSKASKELFVLDWRFNFVALLFDDLNPIIGQWNNPTGDTLAVTFLDTIEDQLADEGAK